MTLKKVSVSFIAFFVVLLGLRSYHVFALIDPETGFMQKSMYINLYIFLVLIFAAVIVINLLASKVKDFPPKIEINRNIFSGFMLIIAAVLIFMDSAYSIMSGVLNPVELICNILGIISAFSLIVIAVLYFVGKNILPQLSVLYVSLSLWFAGYALYFTFVKYENVMNISDNLLNILSNLVLAVFFFTYSKVLSGVITPKTIRRSFSFGLVTLAVSGSYIIPHVVSNILNNKYENFQNYFVDIVTLVLLAFICSYLFSVAKQYREYKDTSLEANNDDGVSEAQLKREEREQMLVSKYGLNRERNDITSENDFEDSYDDFYNINTANQLDTSGDTYVNMVENQNTESTKKDDMSKDSDEEFLQYILSQSTGSENSDKSVDDFVSTDPIKTEELPKEPELKLDSHTSLQVPKYESDKDRVSATVPVLKVGESVLTDEETSSFDVGLTEDLFTTEQKNSGYTDFEPVVMPDPVAYQNTKINNKGCSNVNTVADKAVKDESKSSISFYDGMKELEVGDVDELINDILSDTDL